MSTKNASTSLIMDAISDIQGGAMADMGGNAAESEVEDSDTVNAGDSIEDTDWNDSDSNQPDGEPGAASASTAPASAAASKPAAKTAPDASKTSAQSAAAQKEVITVTDGAGKKQIEIDYTDRAAIKKAFELAHGARKWQAERDKTIASEKQLREQSAADRRVLDALEAAYAQKGELGVIDLIAGTPGASEQFIAKQVARAKFLESASPEEINQLKMQERLAQLEKDHARTLKEQEAREQRIAAEREAADLKALESRVNPAFEKYRFDGKLGDEEDEAMYDEILWTNTMKRLAPLEEQGVEISRELVDRTFRDVSSRLRKRIGAVADKQASAVVAQKKQEALENVQASTTSAYKKGGARAEAEGLIAKGDFKSLFGNWGKFGGK